MGIPRPDVIGDVPFPLQRIGAAAPVRDRLPLRLIELSGCTIGPDWGGGDMTAPTWRLYLDLDDGAEAWCGARCTALRANHLFLIPAWLGWRARCRGLVRHFNAMVDLPSLPRERVAQACRAPVLLAAPGDPLAADWLAGARRHAAAARADAALLAAGHALVWSAFARFFAGAGAALADLAAGDALEGLRHWVEERLDRPLPRAALARAAGISEAELARRCAAVLGTSPARWVRDLRVARAAALLRGSALPLEEVAERCGFADRTRLGKVFARAVGCGPAAFRRRARA